MANPIIKVVLTAVDQVTAVSKTATRSVTDFGSAAVSMAKSVGAVLVSGLLADFFKGAVEEAAEAERGMQRLGNAVTQAGGNFTALRPALEDAVAGVQQLSTATDDELRAALTNMITLTGDVKGSMANLGLAADVAAYKQIGLEEASTLLGKAMAGNTRVLKEFGIDVKAVANPLEALRAKVDGFARVEAESFTGSLTRAWNQLGEVKEAIGNVILSNEQLRGSTGFVATALGNLALFIEKNEDGFGLIVDAVSTFVGALVDVAKTVSDVLAPALGPVFKGLIAALLTALNTVSWAVSGVAATFKVFAGTALEALGTLVELGGNLLSVFGVKVVRETGTSIRQFGETLRRSATADMAQANQIWVAGMGNLVRGHRDGQEDLTAVVAEGENQRTRIATAEGEARVEELRRQLKRIEEALKKHGLEVRDITLSQNHHAREAIRLLGEAMSKYADAPTKEAIATVEDLQGAFERALGAKTKGEASETLQAILTGMQNLKGKLPLDQWINMNGLAQMHIENLRAIINGTQVVNDETARWVSQLNGVVTLSRAFIDSALAAKIIDDEMASALNSVLNMASSLGQFASGNYVSGIVSIVSSLAALIAGWGNSKVEKERLASAAVMSASVDRLAREVGNLALGATGRTFSAVQKATAASDTALQEAIRSRKDPLTAGKIARDAFLKSLLGSGVSLEEANKLMEELIGRSLPGNIKDLGDVDKFFDFLHFMKEGLANTEFGQYAQDVAGQLRAVQDQIELLGLTDDDQKLALYRKALGGKSTLLDSVLFSEDPAEAIKKLQEIAVGLNTGAFKGREAEFGGFTGQQLVGFLKILKPLLEGADGAGGALPGGLAGARAMPSLPTLAPDVMGIGFLSELRTLPVNTGLFSPRPLAVDGGTGLPTGLGPLGGVIAHFDAGAVVLNFKDTRDLSEALQLTAEQVSLLLGRQLSAQRASQGLR